jgi:hypothetical protein
MDASSMGFCEDDEAFLPKGDRVFEMSEPRIFSLPNQAKAIAAEHLKSLFAIHRKIVFCDAK